MANKEDDSFENIDGTRIAIKNNNFIQNYLEIEEKYLATIYFQILRNSKSDYFDIDCLTNFFSFSQKLNSKIYYALSLKDKNSLSLGEFSLGISLLFSRFVSEKTGAICSLIFNIISDNNETISYETIKEFFNTIIFDCFCKIKIYNYEFFIYFCAKIKEFIKSTFNIGKTNSKLCKFTKKDFIKIVHKKPELINIILVLLNLLSPINEKFILKISNINCRLKFFSNDDFEEEEEIEEEKTSRINNLPNDINFKLGNSKDKSDYDLLDDFTSCNNFSKPALNSQPNNFNSNENILLKDKESRKYSFDSIQNISDKLNLNQKHLINYHNNIDNDIYSKNIKCLNDEFKKKTYQSNPKKYNERIQEEISTDISDLTRKSKYGNLNSSDSYNNHSPIRENNFFFNYQNIDKILDTYKNKKEYSIPSNSNIYSSQKDLSIINALGRESELFKNIELLIDEFNNHNEMRIKNIKFPILIRKISDEICENNNILKIINLNQTREENKIFAFEIKIFQDDLFLSLFNNYKKYSKNCKEYHNFQNEDYTNELFDFLIKNQNKNINENHECSIYFYNLKNFIIPFYPKEVLCKNLIILGEKKFIVYGLKLTHINQNYEVFFQSFDELKSFFIILSKKLEKLNRLFFLNSRKNNNIQLIQKIENFSNKQKNFFFFHKLVFKNLKISLMYQTLKKANLTKENLMFLRSLFDVCKLNNFLKLNIFPFSNFYENQKYIILEYSNQDYKIFYEEYLNNYWIYLKNMIISDHLKDEVIKFKKIVNLLKIKDDVSILFKLINLQSNLTKLKI